MIGGNLFRDPVRALWFGYLCRFLYRQLLKHIDVFTVHGKRDDLKSNAPIFESPAASLPLKPGETFRTVEKISLSMWYDLPPGDYYLIFRYDLRLLQDSITRVYRKSLRSADWVVWDTKKYWFHVHQ